VVGVELHPRKPLPESIGSSGGTARHWEPHAVRRLVERNEPVRRTARDLPVRPNSRYDSDDSRRGTRTGRSTSHSFSGNAAPHLPSVTRSFPPAPRQSRTRRPDPQQAECRSRASRKLEAGDRSPSFGTWDRICKLYGWPQTS
jgi:hypothetical protein